MGWVDGLQGKLVALDTAPLIYFIEEHPTYCPLVSPFFEQLDKGTVQVATSVITLSEVLVKPLRDDNEQLAEQYRDILLHVDGLTTVEVSAAIAEQAARLRSQYSLRTPDAIQIATALDVGASTLLTNDIRWPSLQDLHILTLDSLI